VVLAYAISSMFNSIVVSIPKSGISGNWNNTVDAPANVGASVSIPKGISGTGTSPPSSTPVLIQRPGFKFLKGLVVIGTQVFPVNLFWGSFNLKRD